MKKEIYFDNYTFTMNQLSEGIDLFFQYCTRLGVWENEESLYRIFISLLDFIHEHTDQNTTDYLMNIEEAIQDFLETTEVETKEFSGGEESRVLDQKSILEFFEFIESFDLCRDRIGYVLYKIMMISAKHPEKEVIFREYSRIIYSHS